MSAKTTGPAVKQKDRTGPCQAVRCRGCRQYEYGYVSAGWTTCVCGHTQAIHRGEVK